jgi:transcriptional regulator with XRE-family HTH domain
MIDGHNYALMTPGDVARQLAERLRTCRLMRGWKQSTLAARAGVSLASLRRFEQSGQISLKHLLRLSFTLGRLPDFELLLQPPPADSIASLESLSSASKRCRGAK